jgi:hypothetical protein
MRRSKQAKRSVKQAPAKNNKIQTDALEKEFFIVPAQLAKLFQKDIDSLKQQKNQIATQLSKTQTQLKATSAQLKNASKLKSKQLAALKQAAKSLPKTIAALVKELKSIESTLVSTNTKRLKMLALQKTLVAFTKEWAQKSKAKVTTSKTKTKSKPAKKRKPALSLVNTKQDAQANVDQLSNDDDFNTDQASEATS